MTFNGYRVFSKRSSNWKRETRASKVNSRGAFNQTLPAKALLTMRNCNKFARIETFAVHTKQVDLAGGTAGGGGLQRAASCKKKKQLRERERNKAFFGGTHKRKATNGDHVFASSSTDSSCRSRSSSRLNLNVAPAVSC